MSRARRGVGRVGCAVAGAALLVGTAAACGSTATESHDTGGPSLPPAPSANAAALGFGPYFHADARQCSQPDDLLRGKVAGNILDGYDCHHVMTPAEVSGKCSRGIVAVTGGVRPQLPRTTSTHPPTERFPSLTWQARTLCPGHAATTDRGTYAVTVTKVAGGWIVTHFALLTGPGAGTKA